MWDIGRYTRLVTIMRPTVTSDASHAPVETFAEWKKCYMSKQDKRVSEGMEQDKNTGDRYTIWKTAHPVSGLTLKDQLLLDGVTYEIRGIRELGRERIEIETITKY